MTAFTHSRRTVWAGVGQRRGLAHQQRRPRPGVRINSGLPRLAIGALATSPVNGSIWVGTGEANNASENQYGVGVYQQRDRVPSLASGGRHRAERRRSAPHPLDRQVRLRRDQPRALPPSAHRGRAARTGGRCCSRPGRRSIRRALTVTDVIAVPGTSGRKILAVVGWAGYSDPPAVEANGFYVGSGAAGSFAKVGLDR